MVSLLTHICVIRPQWVIQKKCTRFCADMAYCREWNCRHTLKWRHNDHDGVWNHQPHGCLLNRLFRRRSKKTSKLCVTDLRAGKSPAQLASNAVNVSIWWRHHELYNTQSNQLYRPTTLWCMCLIEMGYHYFIINTFAPHRCIVILCF